MNTNGTSILSQFARFLSGILVFRLADWGLYSLLTSMFLLNYICVQVFNALLFFAMKFFFAKNIFEKPVLESNFADGVSNDQKK